MQLRCLFIYLLWVCSAIVEDLLPADYYSASMIGCHVDQYVFAELIEQKLPKIHRHLERAQLQLPLITLQWFLCLFVNTLPTESALRVWDMFFNEGDKVLFRIAIGLLKMHEAKLLAARYGRIQYRDGQLVLTRTMVWQRGNR